jgi:hypothetical protein
VSASPPTGHPPEGKLARTPATDPLWQELKLQYTAARTAEADAQRRLLEAIHDSGGLPPDAAIARWSEAGAAASAALAKLIAYMDKRSLEAIRRTARVGFRGDGGAGTLRDPGPTSP